jgi:Tfp pilus assembly protein PilE
MSKVPTHIFKNILRILLSVPPFAVFIIGVIVFTSLEIPSWWLMPVTIACTIAFIAAGTILSLNFARKISYMAMSGQHEEGLIISKRVNKYFLGVLIMTWILGLFSAVYMPSYAAYRNRGYDASSKYDLEKFYIAAEIYFRKNPEGTIDVESAKQYGFMPTPGVKFEIQRGQRINFSATAFHPNGTETYTINNDREIIGVKRAIPGH